MCVFRSFIINTLQSIGNSHMGVAYIYCNYNEVEKQNPTNLMGCVVQQLFMRKPGLISKLEEAYDKHCQTGTPPSMIDCCQLLQTAAAVFPNIFVVIDALDECAEVTRETVFDKIREVLPTARLLITSRHAFGSQFEVRHSFRVGLQANEVDIENYLHDRIKGCKSLQVHIKRNGDLHGRIVSGILDKTNGM